MLKSPSLDKCVKENSVVTETKAPATPPSQEEDSFMLESDPNMASQTCAMVTLTTPEEGEDKGQGAEDRGQGGETSIVLHDHTYTPQDSHICPSHTGKPCDIDTSSSASGKADDEAVGVVSELGCVVSTPEYVADESGDVANGVGGVVGEQGGVVSSESEGVLSQELFSEEDIEGAGHVEGEADVTCDANTNDGSSVLGGVAGSTHHTDVLDAAEVEIVCCDVRTLLSSTASGSAGVELGPAGVELEPVGVELREARMELGPSEMELDECESDMEQEPEKMVLSDSCDFESAGLDQNSKLEATPTEVLATPIASVTPLPIRETVEGHTHMNGTACAEDHHTHSAVGSTDDHIHHNVTGEGDPKLDEIIHMMPCCERYVLKSRTASQYQLHSLAEKLLGFMVAVNNRQKQYISK